MNQHHHPCPNALVVVLLLWCCASSSGVHAWKNILLPGESFSTSSPYTFLLSHNNLFHFGFRQVSLETQPKTYYLCIWYANLTGHHIVWSANQDRPASEGSYLYFEATLGRLVLLDDWDSPPTPIWTSPSLSSPGKQLLLANSGNLVLTDATTNVVWQSFDHPTYTLLPTQKLLMTSTILSRNSAASNQLGSGNYKLSLFTTFSALTLVSDTRAYWTTPIQTPSYNNYVVFDNETCGLLFYRNIYNAPYATYLPWDWDKGNVVEGAIRRLSLDFDGNLRIYTWNPTSLLWFVAWAAILDECSIPSICGPYAYCVYKPQPSCLCLQGFEPIDSNKTWLGCSPIDKSQPLCSNNPGYIILDQIDPYNDLHYISNISLESCQAICSQSCSYAGFVYGLDSRGCWMKSVPLTNGYPNILRCSFLKVYHSMPLSPYTPASYTLRSSPTNSSLTPDANPPTTIAHSCLIPNVDLSTTNALSLATIPTTVHDTNESLLVSFFALIFVIIIGGLIIFHIIIGVLLCLV